MTIRRVLVVGSGGREHALCWRLAGEPGIEHVTCAPGNPLMSDVAAIRPDVAATDIEAVARLARDMRADLVVVGPEAPLVGGLVDRLERDGVRCFGPTASAARLEGSKAFARQICRAADVPMAAGRAFTEVGPALDFAAALGEPVVIKADGLAGGKGVSVCDTPAEAEAALRAALQERRLGEAGATVVVEEWLDGSEASVIAICDRRTALMLPAARDHKRLADGDTGPNTGGMGAFSPIPELTDEELARVARDIHVPVLTEMARRGSPFRGALFAGLMLTAGGPRLLEFNVRLGDPETQAVLPRLALPLAPLLAAAAEDRLAEAASRSGVSGVTLPVTGDATVALTLAAAGYPDRPRMGDPITGVEEVRRRGRLVFGAGVVREPDDRLVTAAGRVMTVVGSGADVSAAADAAYEAASRIEFSGRQLRRDIGRPVRVAVGGAA